MAADPTPATGSTVADDVERVAVGAVGAAVGVKGEVTIIAWTDDPELRFAAGSVLVTDPPERGPLAVASMRWQGARLVVRFDAVDHRDAAEALRRTRLFVAQAERPPLPDPDDYYDTDLIGLAAHDPDGAPLGTVTGVEHGAGGDRLVLTADGREHLVPFVAQIVPRVDVAAGTLVVDAPEGLFEL